MTIKNSVKIVLTVKISTLRNRRWKGKSCKKLHPKSNLFFTTFGDCKFGEYCRYIYEKENTLAMVELKETIEEIEQFIADVTKLQFENAEKKKRS